MSTPEPIDKPKGLGPRASRLWDRTMTEYELRVDEALVLEDLCRTVDLIEDLRRETSGMGMTYEDIKTGGVRVHAAVVELRQQRETAARLAKQLKLPDNDDARSAGASETVSDKARRAAKARWAVAHGAPA